MPRFDMERARLTRKILDAGRAAFIKQATDGDQGDEAIVQMADVFDGLTGSGKLIKAGEIRQVDGHIYRALVDCYDLPDHSPGVALGTVWAEVTIGTGGTGTPLWSAGVDYVVGDEVEENGIVYVCLQAHTSQAGWNPSAVPALWSEKE